VLEDPGPHPCLHALADPPILPIHQIPEFNRVRRIEAGPSPSRRDEKESRR
jgi:hypothetical protein